MDIDIWLTRFKERWTKHDVEGVLTLFDENVEYFETPFIKLETRSKLVDSWNGILEQEDIHLTYSVFSSEGGKHSVMWDLTYMKGGKRKHCAGTYLIKLNQSNLCTYFYHCCEAENSDS